MKRRPARSVRSRPARVACLEARPDALARALVLGALAGAGCAVPVAPELTPPSDEPTSTTAALALGTSVLTSAPLLWPTLRLVTPTVTKIDPTSATVTWTKGDASAWEGVQIVETGLGDGCAPGRDVCRVRFTTLRPCSAYTYRVTDGNGKVVSTGRFATPAPTIRNLTATARASTATATIAFDADTTLEHYADVRARRSARSPDAPDSWYQIFEAAPGSSTRHVLTGYVGREADDYTFELRLGNFACGVVARGVLTQTP